MWHPDMPLAYQDQVVTGNAKKLARRVPNGSVDIIFADPVYQSIADYRWLAKLAQRVLKPRGVLLAWCSKPKLGRAQLAMERAGMQYVYTLDYVVVAKTGRMRWYNLFCWTTPCLWFQRPGEATRPIKWIPDTHIETILLEVGQPIELRWATGDTFVSTAGPSGSYIWNKNTGVLRRWMDVFCPPGGTVLDPFAGEASIAAVARELGRHCVSFEIQPGVAEKGRERLAMISAQQRFVEWETLPMVEEKTDG